MQNFNAANVPLTGSNLIEASAGTGKTYSIAILMLRLILERQIAVKEVLMVTFTKAAVAELQDRIRLFIRKAYKASKGEEIDDKLIMTLVAEEISREGQQEICERLNAALLLLDETAVMTIHSFCQQTLNEFAFETGQLFDAETLREQKTLINEEVDHFWRTEVVTIKKELLGVMLKEGLSKALITDVVSKNLSGTVYITYNPEETYAFSQADQESNWAVIESLVNNVAFCREKWYNYIIDNETELRKLAAGNKLATKHLLPFIDDPELFMNLIAKKRDSGYVRTLFGVLIEGLDEIANQKNEVSIYVRGLIGHIYHIAIQIITKNIEAYKNRNSVMTFDDMIDNLHKATSGDNGAILATLLQKKYKAVFVDEFQDTDKLQYEIFERIFGEGSILFYIGDPKQSIYAFRKADIQTYFKASQAVKNQYGMNTNYRSAPKLIAAMNNFFQPKPDFDTFHFRNSAEGIKYIPVKAPTGIEDMGLYCGANKMIPMIVYEVDDEDAIALSTARSILELLSNPNYNFQRNGCKTSITPGSIGVLVRKGDQGKLIKKELSKMGIPAVTIDETTILKSNEAKHISFLLNAFQDPVRGNINKALLVPYTGIDRVQLLAIDEDVLVEQFKSYGQLWETDGIYVTLSKFFVDYEVKGRLMNDQQNQGERSLTNLIQLTEILHKVQTNKQFVNVELINWLNKALEGMAIEGDEYEQRVESDEDAVNIVTIHKSKGLEYPIVYAPFLDLTIGEKYNFFSFRDRDRGNYLFAIKGGLSPEQKAEWELQQEQENRRLIYVAITRAVHQVYIFKNKEATSSLDFFCNTSKTLPDNELITFSDCSTITSQAPYNGINQWKPIIRQQAKKFVLRNTNWRKLSYTFLSTPYVYLPKNNSSASVNEYEDFIFKQLPKGKITGNFLHYIFEHIEFTRSSKWEKILAEATLRFLPKLGVNKLPMLIEMIEHSLNARIEIGGNVIDMSKLNQHSKISEFEFDFPVQEFNTKQLDALNTEITPIQTSNDGDYSGIMNGKIDLFFESGGRYYILDWKSNFLGDHLDNYSSTELHNAMTESNYHLQYMIYSVALMKYLELRLENFDYSNQFGGVIYLFFRGLRQNSNTGVFTYRPSIEEITNFRNVFQNN